MPTQKAKKNWSTSNFSKLDAERLCLSVFTEVSFAKNIALSTQLGYIIFLCDGHRNSIILHYSSLKFERVAQSALATEHFAVSSSFGIASTAKVTLDSILEKYISLKFYTDSKSLFDASFWINPPAEKRSLICLSVIRQSYERR